MKGLLQHKESKEVWKRRELANESFVKEKNRMELAGSYTIEIIPAVNECKASQRLTGNALQEL